MTEIYAYHTCRNIGNIINRAPFKSISSNGYQQWLGTGFYFWLDLEYAHSWGRLGRFKNSGYAIVECSIAIEKDEIFDLSNNREHRSYLEELYAYIQNRYSSKFNDYEPNVLEEGFEKISLCSLIEFSRKIDSQNKKEPGFNQGKLLLNYKAVIVRDNKTPDEEKRVYFTSISKEFFDMKPREQMCVFEEYKDCIEVIKLIS